MDLSLKLDLVGICLDIFPLIKKVNTRISSFRIEITRNSFLIGCLKNKKFFVWFDSKKQNESSWKPDKSIIDNYQKILSKVFSKVRQDAPTIKKVKVIFNQNEIKIRRSWQQIDTIKNNAIIKQFTDFIIFNVSPLEKIRLLLLGRHDPQSLLFKDDFPRDLFKTIINLI